MMSDDCSQLKKWAELTMSNPTEKENLILLVEQVLSPRLGQCKIKSFNYYIIYYGLMPFTLNVFIDYKT